MDAVASWDTLPMLWNEGAACLVEGDEGKKGEPDWLDISRQ